MLWLVPGFRGFPLPLLLLPTFGIDAGRLYAVLQDKSVGILAARPRNPQSEHKTATSLIQVVVDCFWCSRNPQPSYQTSPIQIVIGFSRCPICWSFVAEIRRAIEVCSEGHTWGAFKSIFASTANRAFVMGSGRVRSARNKFFPFQLKHHASECYAALRGWHVNETTNDSDATPASVQTVLPYPGAQAKPEPKY